MKKKKKSMIGVFIIPSLLTTANLYSGFYSIIATLKSDYSTASIAILVGMLFDGFDGKVARLTNSTSRFGVEYDSLADIVSFGIAPGLLIYTWTLNSFGKIGWLAVFLFIACGAMRLARFNVQASSVEDKFFTGLPIPAAAGLIATTVMFDRHILEMGKEVRPFVILLMTYVLAYLMVSTIHYKSFKEIRLSEKKPLSTLIAAILILIVIVAEPQIMLFLIFLIYVSSGPVEKVIVYIKRLSGRKGDIKEADIAKDKDI